MATCKKCGLQASESDVFCTNCGNRIVAGTKSAAVPDTKTPDAGSKQWIQYLLFVVTLVGLGLLGYSGYEKLQSFQNGRMAGGGATNSPSEDLRASGAEKNAAEKGISEFGVDLQNSDAISNDGTGSSSPDTDVRAEAFLKAHYTDIAAHRFREAYSHFDRENLVVNGHRVAFKPSSSNYNEAKFSEQWKNVKDIKIMNFKKISELAYSYDVTISYDNEPTGVMETNPMVLKKTADGGFQIIKFSAQ